MPQFKLVGDGATTSSIAITTFDIADAYPSIPEPFSPDANALALVTDSGFAHMFKLGEVQRSWTIGLRLLTFANWRKLQTIYETAGKHNWLFWEWFTGTANGSSTTLITSSGATIATADYYRSLTAVITDTTDELAPEGEIRRCSAYVYSGGNGQWTVATAYTATLTSGDTFSIGWPVRFTSALERRSMGNDLYDVDFTIQEVLFSGTV